MLASRSAGSSGSVRPGRRAAEPDVGLHRTGPVDQLQRPAGQPRRRRCRDGLPLAAQPGSAAATASRAADGSRSPTSTRVLPAGSTRSPVQRAQRGRRHPLDQLGAGSWAA